MNVFTVISLKYEHFTASNGGEDEGNFLVLFDMFIYSMRSIQPYHFQPKYSLPRLFQHFGFSLDHHARSRSPTRNVAEYIWHVSAAAIMRPMRPETCASAQTLPDHPSFTTHLIAHAPRPPAAANRRPIRRRSHASGRRRHPRCK